MLFSQQAKQFEEEEGSTNENRHINLACVFQYNVGSYALYLCQVTVSNVTTQLRDRSI